MIKWFRRKKKDAPEVPEEIRDQEPRPEEPSEVEAPEPEAQRPREETAEAARSVPLEEEVPAESPSETEPAANPPLEPELSEPREVSEEWLDSEGEEVLEDVPEKGRFYKKLRERLHKTREQFVNRVDRLVFGKKTIDADLLDDLEEILITSDLGVQTTQLLLKKVTDRIKRQELRDPEKLREQLRDEIKEILSSADRPWDLRAHRPLVVMVIGVNGVGKTTTIGKLAHQLKSQGLNVLLVAADTFRAAAVEQLSLWADRVGVPIVRQKSGSDPSAVAFDALDAALSRNVDIVLLDTAGRMHTKVNLMEELKKIQRVIGKKMEDAPHEILLVLDATTGQNALSQARLFKQEIGLTGLILTKLDGTAKGGIIVAISDELQVPVRFIGIGESIEDLRPFDPDEFTRALF